MGWILKLLVKLPAGSDREKFYLEDTITEAYCRIRGFECRIEQNPDLNPKFWIKDEKDESGKPVPHQSCMMGRDGYNWTIDYSDEGELKEYTLH